MKQILLMLNLFVAFNGIQAQNTVKGTIRIKNSVESLAGITVLVKGSSAGTTTDSAGHFEVPVRSFPATLIISAVGYQEVDIPVVSNEAGLIYIEPVSIPGDDVVVTASLFEQKSKKAPVSIQTYNHRQINTSPATSYYDHAQSRMGIDMTTSSLTFRTISTRGFNGSGSTRTNQRMDGMENITPGLNFPLGGFIGLTDLDVERVEILPGASSVFYGSGGINGTILVNSKNPFQYEGLSIQLKEGVSNVDKTQRSSISNFHDLSMRFAKAFNDKFAFKLGIQYTKAIDWLASDSSNYSRIGDAGKVIPGTRLTDPNYDGVNRYGDETSVDIYPIMMALGMPPEHIKVSRTGYEEKDIIDPVTKNVRFSGSAIWKIRRQLEAELMGYWANGNTVYTGNNRYSLKGIQVGQYKLELRSKNWFIRTYTTQEDAGEAYSATVSAQVLNEIWKPSYNPSNAAGSWYPQFVGAYGQALMAGADKATALQMARAYADRDRPAAGSDQFNQMLDKARSMPLPNGGLFKETSQLWMTEGQYRLNQLKFANITVGANYKQYILNSDGTLFIDQPGSPIKFSEYGAYGQVTKDFFEKKLTLSVAGRYDKNEDFEGRFTPRATAVVEVAKDHNIRFSYQTAYRFPSTQQKYIKLNVGSYTILGGLPWILDTMGVKTHPVYDATTMQPFEYKDLKPEACRSFEVGYKAVINKKLLVDAYVYFGEYTDFLGRQTLVQAVTNKVYSVVVNSDKDVKTHGFGLGLDYMINNRYSAFLNGSSDVITDVPDGFRTYFNTPKYRMNGGFAAQNLGANKAIGFNVMARWQDAFNWDGELANGPVPAFFTMDAAVSYRIQPIRTTLKLGGTNVFNHYYKNAYANPEVGGLYYMSLRFDL